MWHSAFLTPLNTDHNMNMHYGRFYECFTFVLSCIIIFIAYVTLLRMQFVLYVYLHSMRILLEAPVLVIRFLYCFISYSVFV